jgi:hypothetical protein
VKFLVDAQLPQADSGGCVMPTGDVETYCSNNQWHNRIEGTGFVFGSDPTRGGAVRAGSLRTRTDATTHTVRRLTDRSSSATATARQLMGEAARRPRDAHRATILAGFR